MFFQRSEMLESLRWSPRGNHLPRLETNEEPARIFVQVKSTSLAGNMYTLLSSSAPLRCPGSFSSSEFYVYAMTMRTSDTATRLFKRRRETLRSGFCVSRQTLPKTPKKNTDRTRSRIAVTSNNCRAIYISSRGRPGAVSPVH